MMAVLASHSAYVQRVSYIVGDRNDLVVAVSPTASLFPRLLLHAGLLMQELAWTHALLEIFSMPSSALALMIKLRL